MKIPIFPGKYHQNGGFSWAMLVSGRVLFFELMFTRVDQIININGGSNSIIKCLVMLSRVSPEKDIVHCLAGSYFMAYYESMDGNICTYTWILMF